MELKMFASDNNSGVHPAIIQALATANLNHAPAYGSDLKTESAILKFKEHFGQACEVLFVFNGTGANVTGLKAMVRSHQAIICTDGAHIHSDEGGAAEGFIGGKLLTSPSKNGKLTISDIEKHLHNIGNQQRSQPKAVSISQCTELGTVYSIEEIKEITAFAHANGLFVHMDGARISNAAAHLGCSLAEMTVDAGIDMLAFGGTKNGMMFGEAVVCFHKDLATDLPYIRKQGMQLGSKMRFLSAQFECLLTDDLWLENALHANAMAKLLTNGLKKLPGVTLTQEVQSNAVFLSMPRKQIEKLQQSFAFAVWNEQMNEIRLVTSFDTTEKDVEALIEAASQTIS